MGIRPQKYIKVNSLDAGLLMVEANISMMFIPDFLYPIFGDTLQCLYSGQVADRHFACLHMSSNANPTLKLFVNGISTSDTLSGLRCTPIME